MRIAPAAGRGPKEGHSALSRAARIGGGYDRQDGREPAPPATGRDGFRMGRGWLPEGSALGAGEGFARSRLQWEGGGRQ
jgi:hypothetical protein